MDWTRCDARGVCLELLPELLAADRWGYPVAPEDGDPEVPRRLAEVARLAVRDCPRIALSLLDGDA